MTILLCSGCRTFIEVITIPILIIYRYTTNKYWRFYIFYCTTCIVYQYVKELNRFVSKAGAKVRGFILTAKSFRKFFYFFLYIVSQTLLRKGKKVKKKNKTPFLCEPDCKDKNFYLYPPNFAGSFFVLIRGRPCAFTTSQFWKASFSWKADAKVRLIGIRSKSERDFFLYFFQKNR